MMEENISTIQPKELQLLKQNIYDSTLLWQTVTAFAGHTFKTSGRGAKHSGAVEFTYSLKVSNRTGLPTDELIISTRENVKTITRSTVELVLKKYLEVQERDGYVKGPKSAGQIFGASYLYSMFLEWGLIKKMED